MEKYDYYAAVKSDVMDWLEEHKEGKIDESREQEIYEPCAECRAKFAQGVHLIEVADDGSRFGESERFALKDDTGARHWPTGRFAVLRPGKAGNAGERRLCDARTMNYVLNLKEG